MQRSGAITPRRAAWARSKREVWVGKRSATWRAISAPVAVMPMNTGPVQLADAGAGLLAERGVGLVADHDRVGVGDAARVAHEPLVGLDGDRAVGVVGAVEQRRREPLLVAAVGDLADELVDEVAAVGEDQDAAGARGLDEADRGDRLAGAGRVLEPEAPARRPGPRAPRRRSSASASASGSSQSWGSSSGASTSSSSELGARRCRSRPRPLVGRSTSRPLPRPLRRAVALRALELGDDRGQRSGERVDLVLVELGAVEQLAACSSEQPLEPEQQRVVAAPLERRRLGAGVELGERGVDRPPARGAGREVGDRLALEQDRLAGELPHPIEVGLAQLARRARGNVGGVGHWKGDCGPALAC